MKRAFVVCILLVSSAASGQTPQSTKPSQQLLSRLPEDWRPVISQMEIDADSENYYQGLADAQLQGALLQSLAYSPKSADFVLDHLQTLKTARDEADVVRSFPYAEHWLTNLRVIPVLNGLTHPGIDPHLALAAFHSLHLLQAHKERLLVEGQLESAEGEARQKLAIQDESLMDAEKDAVIPVYLREVPPVFAVLPPKSSIRVLGFGDFGTGKEPQKRVAAAMVQYGKKHKFDFGITLGDNFTPVGMASPQDPRWQTEWEDLYGPMKIKFYPSFGNHDWSSPESPAAELSYKSSSGNWIMPAPYYTYTAGPAQFFAIDTGLTGSMSLVQLQWLKAELESSHARWKIVYGHHPPYIATGTGENPIVVRELMPVLKSRADVYIAGHYHTLEHLKPVDGVNLYVSAGGGRPLYPLDPPNDRALFAKSMYGFSVLEIDDHAFTVRFIGEDGTALDESTIRK